MNQIAIWGTSEKAKQYYAKLIKRRVRVVGFIDNDASKWNTQFLDGIPVWDPLTAMKNKGAFECILIASMYHPEIKSQLVCDLGYDEAQIFVRPKKDWTTTLKTKMAQALNRMKRRLLGLAYPLLPNYIQYKYAQRIKESQRIANLAAWHYENSDIDPTLILYESYNGRDFSCNPYAIFKYMMLNDIGKQFHHVIVTSNGECSKVKEFLSRHNVEVVKIDTPAYIIKAQTCKYYINNCSFRPYVIKKTGQIYITSWHSTLLKKLGIHTNRPWETKNVSRMFLNSDYHFSPNCFTTENLLSSHGVTDLYAGKIFHVGYPRNDLTINVDKCTIRKRLNVTDSKKIALYAPTWKGNYKAINNVREVIANLLIIRKLLGDDYIVLAKFHTMVYPHLTKEEEQYCTPGDIDTNEILGVTDLLITDYSGIFYDFLLTGNPVVFYAPDYDKYLKEKSGLYLSMADFPGPLCKTESELAEYLSTPSTIKEKFSEKYESFKQKFCGQDDGAATERLCKICFQSDSSSEFWISNTKKKKLLIHSGTLYMNGVTSSLIQLLDQIDYSNTSVTVLLPDHAKERGNQSRLNKNALIIYNTYSLGFASVEEFKDVRTQLSHFLDTRFDTTNYWRRNFRRIFGDTVFDACINHNGYTPMWAAFIALGTSCPVKAIYLHNDLDEDRKIKNPALSSVFSHYRLYDKLICVSEDSLESNRAKIPSYTSQKFGFNPESKMTYVGNFFPFKDIASLSNELEIIGDSYVIQNSLSTNPSIKYRRLIPRPLPTNINFITIGRLSPEKNHVLMLDSFRKVKSIHPNVRLYIVGTGVKHNEITNYITQHDLQDHVIMAGRMVNPFPLLKLCDCFLLSSLIEGQPIVLLEAMTIGIPIISTNIPGPRRLLSTPGRTYGALVDANLESFSDKMAEFIELKDHGFQFDTFDPITYTNDTIAMFNKNVFPCCTLSNQEVNKP